MSNVFTEKEYNYVELPIFVKSYNFLKWLLPTTDSFPKKVRVTLVNRLNSLLLEFLEDIIEAKYSKLKSPILRNANLKLEKLRILLRFSHDMKFISFKSYEYSMTEVNEIGKMIGGWMKQQEDRL